MNYAFEEKRLSLKLCTILSDEFDIIHESEIMKNPGKFSLDGNTYKAIPDLLLKPKKHLVELLNFNCEIIPVEIKKFKNIDCNKFEDLMFQCHTYRFSSFQDVFPKLCLYFIDDYFEHKQGNTHLEYDYEISKNPRTIDYQIRSQIREKNKIETIFGRFGIGEVVTNENGYVFRLKRQVFFKKDMNESIYKPNILTFSLGTSGKRKAFK